MQLNQKLELFPILKQALMIPYKNTNFILLSSFASIPLLCFMLFHEPTLQKTLVSTMEMLRQPSPTYSNHWLIPFMETRRMINALSYKLIQLSLLHLLPLHLLELFVVVVTVDLTAKTYTTEKQINPREMVQRILNKARCKGIFITSGYVYFISTCVLVGSTWLFANCYIIVRIFLYNTFTTALLRIASMAVLVKYLEWTAIWNISIVVSILEDVYGADALGLSAYLWRGRGGQGSLLILVFFMWSAGLRLAYFYGGCNGKDWTRVVQVCLICMGNVIKWVACVIYFYHHKEKNKQKVDSKIVF